MVSSCLLRCKDEHMTKLDNEWSDSFIFDVSLLRESEEAAHQRTLDICENNNKLDECIKKCNDSTERRVLQMGLEPWKEICGNLEELLTQFSCWRDNLDTLTLSCHIESHGLRRTLDTFAHNTSLLIVEVVCREMTNLSMCLIKHYGRYCGSITKKILLQLMKSSRKTITDVLRVRWEILPEACTEDLAFFREVEDAITMELKENKSIRQHAHNMAGFISLLYLYYFNYIKII
uniref:Uncharacterized protein n=1 Tax=Acrobeloides nanus TaxID=290746 RepID=A0A914DXF3_9BILA